MIQLYLVTGTYNIKINRTNTIQVVEKQLHLKTTVAVYQTETRFHMNS